MSGEEPAAPDSSAPPAESRPLIERAGLATIALVVTTMFAALAAAAFGGGEVYLGVMAGIGAAMTVWAAASTLRRG
jgi:ABC-type thiamin/hydroxymethylpyrimidine transport system permease subunit